MKLPVDDMCSSCRCHMLNGVRASVRFVCMKMRRSGTAFVVAYQWNNSNYCYLLSVAVMKF